MKGYTQSDVARLLELSVGQVRSLTRAGFLHPRRGPRGEYRYTFQDLVLLKAAKGLHAARIPARKIRRALEKLRNQLPSGRSLSAVQITAFGEDVVVRDGSLAWEPSTGQAVFDFEVSDLARKVAPLARRAAEEAFESGDEYSAEQWYGVGCELEPADPEQAREAYRRALELEPGHVEAHINLGRLLHEVGDLKWAEHHYREALAARPADPTALFNLGVSLEDLGNEAQAIVAYGRAVEADPALADAHFNLARLYEQRGDHGAALRHFNSYRRLNRDPGTSH